ncbi:MAG: hypothetical protein J1F32_02355 [Erysipelotrichales bacterium]|nr:hypothetical protein [Erysipelotrichales bacterium]
MAEEITDFNDEELTRKLLAKRRVRGLLIAVNFVLFGYLAYQIGANIVHLVRTANDVEGIVPIADKNQKESLEIYKAYVNNDKIFNADFAIYGDKIYFTDGNFNKDNIKTIENVQLIEVQADKSKDIIIKNNLAYDNIDEYLTSGVSLFYDKTGKKPLEKGDYLFYHDYDNPTDYGEAIKVTNQLDMKYEIYSSLNNEYDFCIKTTIYAYKNNPALVMNVDYIASLPDNCYDVVIVGEAEKAEKIKNELYTNQKVLIKETIIDKELFKINARELVKVTDEISDNEERVTYSSVLLNDGLDKSKSEDPFIVNNAGYAMSRGFEYEFNNEHYAGKLAKIIELENK